MPDTDHHTGDGDAGQPSRLNSLTSLTSLTLRRDQALIGLAGDVVKSIEPISEADPAALLLHFLTMFGNAVGDGLYARLGPSKHPARLFSIVVGDAATGRKGTAGSEIKRLMAEADRKWYKRSIASGVQSAEALVDMVDDEVGETNELLLFYPEFGELLDTILKRKNMSNKLKEAYDGESLRVRTKNRKGNRTASHAHISVMGHVTPDTLLANLSDAEKVSGFANRFLFAKVAQTGDIPLPEPLDEETLDALAERVDESLSWANKFALETTDPISKHLYKYFNVRHLKPKREMSLSDSARTYWFGELSAELKAKRRPIVRDFVTRAPSNVMRLAVTYAILDMSPVIDKIHLEAGKAVWDYCEASITEIFMGATGDIKSDRILRELANAPDGKLTKSDIHGIFSRHLSSTTINAIIQRLIDDKFVIYARVPPVGGKGRPIETYTLGEISEKSEKSLVS